MKKIKVLKFGGSSLKTIEDRKKVISIIQNELIDFKVVVIVSAIGRYPSPYATDTLIHLSKNLQGKQKDEIMSCGELISSHVLCSECLECNLNAVSLNICENGIYTNMKYNDADIIHVDTNTIYQYLNKHDLVIVPGFFGINQYQHISSLGRGGSDLSAVAIAHGLGLNEVTIYSDVKGIYSCDPKKFTNAILYPFVNYQQAMILSNLNVQVLQNKACLYAYKNKIDIILKSTFCKDGYTRVVRECENHNYLIFEENHYLLISKFNEIIHFNASLPIQNAHELFIE